MLLTSPLQTEPRLSHNSQHINIAPHEFYEAAHDRWIFNAPLVGTGNAITEIAHVERVTVSSRVVLENSKVHIYVTLDRGGRRMLCHQFLDFRNVTPCICRVVLRLVNIGRNGCLKHRGKRTLKDVAIVIRKGPPKIER